MNFEINTRKRKIKLAIHPIVYAMVFVIVLLTMLAPYIETAVQPSSTTVIVNETKVIEPTYEVTTTAGKGVCITDVHNNTECYE